MEQLQDFFTNGEITSCEETHDGVVITRTVGTPLPSGDANPTTTLTISGVTAADFQFS